MVSRSANRHRQRLTTEDMIHRLDFWPQILIHWPMFCGGLHDCMVALLSWRRTEVWICPIILTEEHSIERISPVSEFPGTGSSFGS